MLPITTDHVRIYLHVLAACVWIGGQITLAALVPVLRRRSDRDTVHAVARQFQRVAWPAFAVLLATGVWNLIAVEVGDQSSEYLVTLFLKLTCVALSGIGAAIHALAVGPRVTEQSGNAALSGAMAGIGLLFALGAALLGVVL